MDSKNTGLPVTVEEMMAFRDERARIQKEMLAAHHLPVVSFSMNIPGEIKTGERISKAFDAGMEELRLRLIKESYEILEEKLCHENAGDQWIAAVNATAETLKEMATSIEETHIYGRLFDMDVLDENGNKLSRAVPRRCLICNKEAALCARSRAHDLGQLKNAVDKILSGEQPHPTNE